MKGDFKMNWIACNCNLPEENIVVNTKIDDWQGERNQQMLVRKGNLWFLQDQNVYIYYNPTHWAYCE